MAADTPSGASPLPRTSTALRVQASEAVGLDHIPACPRCGNLCAVAATVCPTCYAPLVLAPTKATR